VYCTGLNIALRISFTLVMLPIQNLQSCKQGDSLRRMAGAGFQSDSNSCAPIFNYVVHGPVADRGVYSVDCNNKNGRTAYCQSQKSKFKS
jgi:hypothetical protein